MVWAAGLLALLVLLGWRRKTPLPFATAAQATFRFLWMSTSTVLYLPVLSSLLRVFSCSAEAKWMATELVCWQGLHMGLACTVAVLLVAFVGMTHLLTLMLVERRLGSRAANARYHGRKDAWRLAMLTFIAVLHQALREDQVADSVPSVTLAAVSFCWLLACLKQRPYYKGVMNNVDTGEWRLRALLAAPLERIPDMPRSATTARAQASRHASRGRAWCS